MNPLSSLGRKVAEAQDAELAESTAKSEARARLLAATPAVRRTSIATPVRVGIALAAAAAVAVGAFSLLRHRALTFEVAGAPGRGGEWIAPKGDTQVAVAFSDGSRVELSRDSRARVTDLERDGARIVLERGQAHAAFVHTGHASWHVLAGPMDVKVTGTRFDVGWDATTERFSLTLTEGSVEVSGNALDQPLRVTAGQSLEVRVREHRFAMGTTGATASNAASAEGPKTAPNATAGTSVAALDAPAAEPPQPEAAPPRAIAPSIPAAPATVTSAEWQKLAASGRWAEAYADADAHGFSEICNTASAADLDRLAVAARTVGRFDRAADALSAIRRRFSGADRAKAAFSLGRLAYDQKSAYAEAATWFSTYLREAPSGAYAELAAGRLIEAYKAGGDSASARTAAQSYLAKWPDGPHAPLAKSLEGRE